MDNQDNKLSKEQELALNEELQRGVAFEEMVTTKGWQFIVAYYQNHIASFMNDMMNPANSLESLEEKRRELMGLKKLLGQVDQSISTLNRSREEANGKSA